MTQRRPLTVIENAIYRQLVAAAEANAPCPTNDHLSEAISNTSGNVPPIIRALIRKDYVTVESGTRWRIVTITETGKRTCLGVRPERGPKANSTAAEQAYIRERAEKQIAEIEDIAKRIERDQARLRAERERHLDEEQRKYGLKRRGRLIDEMPA